MNQPFPCKTVIEILNCHLMAVIQFHDTLHGFYTFRGTGTTSPKSIMLQQLVDMREYVLYEIFYICIKPIRTWTMDTVCKSLWCTEWDPGPFTFS